MVISLELCFLMEPPKPTKLPSFIAERMSLLAENRSFSNILRRSYFSTGHLRQCMSPDLPASFSLSKYKPAKRKKKKAHTGNCSLTTDKILSCSENTFAPPRAKEGFLVAQQ